MYSKIDITKMKNPSFLMVLTATGNYAYKRDDGVYVVPIGCLKIKISVAHLQKYFCYVKFDFL